MNEPPKIKELEEQIKLLKLDVDELKKEVKHLNQNMLPNTHSSKLNATLMPESREDKVTTVPIKSKPTSNKTFVPKTKEQVTEKLNDEPKEESRDWERIIGQVWLPRIFVLILILGVLWGFKVAVDQGWLNESTRVMIGVIAAISVYGIAHLQEKKQHLGLAKSLYVGSIGIFIFTVFAMSFLYDMVPTLVALTLGVVAIVVGIYKSDQLNSQAMGIMFTIIGHLLPFIVGGEGTLVTAVLLVGYQLFFYIALALFAMKRDYQILNITSAAFFHLTGSMIVLFAPHEQEIEIMFAVLVGAIIQHALIYYQTWNKPTLSVVNRFMLSGSYFLTFVAWLLSLQSSVTLFVDYLYYDDEEYISDFTRLLDNFDIVSLILGLITIVYTVSTVVGLKRKNKDLMDVSMALTWVSFSVFVLNISWLDELQLGIFIIQAVAWIYFGYRFNSKIQRVIGFGVLSCVTFVVAVTLWLPNQDMLFDEEYRDMLNYYVQDMILIGIWVTAILFTLKLIKMYEVTIDKETKQKIELSVVTIASIIFLKILPSFNDIYEYPVFLWILVIAYLAYIYQTTMQTVSTMLKAYMIFNMLVHLIFLTTLANSLPSSYDVSVISVTLSWVLYASTCLVIGFKLNHKFIRLAGLSVLAIAVVKLILFDLAELDFGIRAILFVLVGIVGMLLSRLFYKKAD